jgi:2-polyprenyl-3-methyl-5-hydroxy-6-metoxy-1,4-benzoquinol methylase
VTRKSVTVPPEYFEEKYRANIDPWRFRTSEYERNKYQATIEALTNDRYSAALEVGCSIGVLTRLLSQRCVNLLAIDASATALKAAKSVNDTSVTFKVANLPAEFPEGKFDLIVLSEILYYFSSPDLERVAVSCMKSLTKDGEIVLCHWLGETDYPLTGVEASELFSRQINQAARFRSILHDDVYRLERYSAC